MSISSKKSRGSSLTGEEGTQDGRKSVLIKAQTFITTESPIREFCKVSDGTKEPEKSCDIPPLRDDFPKPKRSSDKRGSSLSKSQPQKKASTNFLRNDEGTCRVNLNLSAFNLRREVRGKCARDEEEDGETTDEEEGLNEEGGGEGDEDESGEGAKGSNQRTSETDPSKLTEKQSQARLSALQGMFQPELDVPSEYRPDYPYDLRLLKECVPKQPSKWKTQDNFLTEPVAKFLPSPSTDQLLAEKYGDKRKSKPKVLSSQEKEVCQPTAREPPPVVSVTDEIVMTYLVDYNIQMLLEYLLSLCILNTPQDPVSYISTVVDKLANGRHSDQAFREIPRLLSPSHLEALFRIYDRIGTGLITRDQYVNAMTSMGLLKYNLKPAGFEEDEITKESFVTEASNAIDDLLRSFLRKNASNNTC